MICISFLGLTRKKIIFSSGSNLYLIHLYKYVVFFFHISASSIVQSGVNAQEQTSSTYYSYNTTVNIEIRLTEADRKRLTQKKSHLLALLLHLFQFSIGRQFT